MRLNSAFLCLLVVFAVSPYLSHAAPNCGELLKKRWGTDYFVSKDLKTAQEFAQARLMSDENVKPYVGKTCQDKVGKFFIAGLEGTDKPGKKIQDEKIKKKFQSAGKTFHDKKRSAFVCTQEKPSGCFNKAMSFLYKDQGFESRNFFRFGCNYGDKDCCQMAVYFSEIFESTSRAERMRKKLKSLK